MVTRVAVAYRGDCPLKALGRVELIEADKADVVVLGGSQSAAEVGTGIAAE
jgi:lysine/ornithine N-monooxygenase